MLCQRIPSCRGVYFQSGEKVQQRWNLVVSQPYSFITDPPDDTQPIYVIAKKGLTVSLYCLIRNEGSGGAVIRTSWQTKRSNENIFENVTFGSGVSNGPAYLVDKIEATGLISGTHSNFTLLNFTHDFNLISFRCGQPSEDARIFTLGLPVLPSLLINVPVQTVTEGEDITVPLQQSGSNPFPPCLSSELSLNGNPVSNTGVTVNNYTVSFTNVQRNQSGIYTLTVSNDAGTSNTTFTLDVQ
uniref:Immunoglobulin domain-containing protein n=1 Tax=Amphimedon queenslandica TaxID=400682 RepID=A0A1X7SIB1_AMPQE